LISFTVLRRSSSAFPSGEPMCVSEIKAKRKGFICAWVKKIKRNSSKNEKIFFIVIR
jgi:hypothetical protein